MTDRDDDLQSYPEWLKTAEGDAILKRRKTVKSGDENWRGEDRPHVGLALSGGGIRSATFSLGVIQALARKDLLRNVDFVSTVSGGGYMGAFLGALYSRQPEADKAVANVRDTLVKFPESFPIRWLRRNGQYLSPTGPGDMWLAIAMLLRNWIAVCVVLALGAVTIALCGEIFHFAMYGVRALLTDRPLFWGHPHVVGGVWLSPLFFVPFVVLVSLAVSAGVAYWLVPVNRATTGRRYGLVSVILLLVIGSGVVFVYWMRELTGGRDPAMAGPVAALWLIGAMT